MPSTKDWEADGSVATSEPTSRESVKRHRSSRTTSERKDRDRERDRDRDYRERDRERDVDRERAPRDKSRYREGDRDRDRDRDRHRDRDSERDRYREREDKDSSLSSSTHRRHHSTRSSKRPGDSEKLLYTSRSHSHRQRRSRADMDKEEPGYKSAAASSMTELVPELARTLGERVSLPYPSVNKNYSKEALYSKEDVSAPTRRTDPPTPEATDLGSSEMKRSKSTNSPGIARQKSTRQSSRQDDRPPSPPETDLSDPKKRSGTPSSQQEDDRPGSRSSFISRSTSKHDYKSKLSRASSQATFVLRAAPSTRQSKQEGSEITNPSTVDSDATQVLPRRTQSTRPRVETVDSSPESAVDSSPKTPLHTQNFPPPPPPVLPGEKDHYATSDVNHYDTSDVHNNNHYSTSDVPTPSATPAIHPNGAAPPPPPPPPPPPASIDPQDVPRVDYLIQNGGLPQPVPRQFLSVLPRQNGTRPSNPPLQGAETLFAPFFNLLNQYQTVINGNGSVAVATGHRTVARRLLDRLENVFNRDLPPHGCSCIMCERSAEPHRGLGWGEVLERVSGRVELPSWPPFDFSMLAGKAVEELADVPPRPSSPIKMDPDIAEEFREHYLRQTHRVKMAVDKWMVNCEKTPAPPPTEVDDETLGFAILTNLDPDDRPYFNAVLSGSRELQPANRAPTPARKSRNDFVVKAGLSLQRLYRLPVAPRDAETAVYLVRNPAWHDLLVTISEITASEWEVLTSGRFDGFLWSGAEDDGIPFGEGPSRLTTPASNIPSRLMSPGVRGGMSRTTTPFGGGPMSRNTTPFGGFSRGPTPASFISGVSAASSSYPSNRASITHDEETEIACLAELEREIFNGMEALEDAFEKLHEQAMGVRDALRRRGAALSMSLQQRRGGLGMRGIDVLPLSGSSGVYDRPGWADDESVDGADSEWGADEMSELAPDDSASQISSNRMRRPKRRRERATPGVIEEEDEQ
ncbi:hypothetical protein QBC40DRAFT_326967 [Triangularia verruculosa]|uniref:Uncharacterized protein n=1 Tax=Triangularia verruculosa TaxID=2587418 RepID=A0AAN7AVM2_9PEZI|nr:hypothetical protein QBC40DRAFT_326967 [Triangularia verruculosa]